MDKLGQLKVMMVPTTCSGWDHPGVHVYVEGLLRHMTKKIWVWKPNRFVEYEDTDVVWGKELGLCYQRSVPLEEGDVVDLSQFSPCLKGRATIVEVEVLDEMSVDPDAMVTLFYEEVAQLLKAA